MTPFQAYTLYCALNSHFTSSYDYFKYNGKMRLKQETFEKRNDRYSFTKLADHPSPLDLLVACHVDGSVKWVGDVVSEKGAKVYNEWRRRTSSLTYTFERDLNSIDGLYGPPLFLVKEGQHPIMLTRCMQNRFSIESLIMLDTCIGCLKYWNRNITDTIVWPHYYKKCLKYYPFLKFDHVKTSQIFSKFVNSQPK